jgi:hypothetical protein
METLLSASGREMTQTSLFFDKMLRSAPSEPEKDYALICEAWREACDADWIWLFLLDSTLRL